MTENRADHGLAETGPRSPAAASPTAPQDAFPAPWLRPWPQRETLASRSPPRAFQGHQSARLDDPLQETYLARVARSSSTGTRRSRTMDSRAAVAQWPERPASIRVVEGSIPSSRALPGLLGRVGTALPR